MRGATVDERSELVVLDLYQVQTAYLSLAPTNNRWPVGLFERVNQRITRQIETVEDMTGDMDPKTNFALIVIQTELERYKYLVRSFLRSRIAKVSCGLSSRSSPVTCVTCINCVTAGRCGPFGLLQTQIRRAATNANRTQ